MATKKSNDYGISGVKFIKQIQSYNYTSRINREVGLDSVRTVSSPDGHAVMPKEGIANYGEYYSLVVIGPDKETYNRVFYVGDTPIDDYHGVNLAGITSEDGLVFIQTSWPHYYMHVFKGKFHIATICDDTTTFFMPFKDSDNGKTTFKFIYDSERLPYIPNEKLTASRFREAVAVIDAEYNRLKKNKPIVRQVNYSAVKRAVGEFFFNKFYDVVESCDKKGFTTEVTILKLKRIVNADYFTTDEGAIGGTTLYFPEAGL